MRNMRKGNKCLMYCSLYRQEGNTLVSFIWIALEIIKGLSQVIEYNKLYSLDPRKAEAAGTKVSILFRDI